jgi:hypothetical protein
MNAKELIKEILEMETNIEDAEVILDGECIGVRSLPDREEGLAQYYWLYIGKSIKELSL